MINSGCDKIGQAFRHLALLAILILFTWSSFAQANKDVPVAIATGKGIWIYLGHEIPKDFEYQILKKQGNGDFKVIGRTGYSNDPSILKERIEKYSVFFPDLEPLGDKDLTRIRNYAVKSTVTDSLTLPNLPLMHLALGTAFFDEDAKAGVDYQYQVKKTDRTKSVIHEELSNTVRLPARADVLKPVYKSKQEMNRQVILQWYVPDKRKLSSFTVYRRVFGSGEYKRILARKGFTTLNDTLCLIVADTTVHNPGYYEYYIQPVDIYGNAGPQSDVIGAGPKADATMSMLLHLRAKGIETNHQIRLSWKLSNSKYLRGIEIFRSALYDSGFRKIAVVPATDTVYLDNVPKANENYYYYLIIDRASEKSLPSAKVSAMFSAAKERPAPPSEISAETVKGGVKIHWSDQDPYLKGFFIYRYVYEKGEYAQISDLIPTREGLLYEYTDSSKAIAGNETYRYAVKTVNDVEQLSDFSASADGRPGKKAHVVTPMNLITHENEKGVMLIWDDLTPAESNLLGYKVYRKSDQEAAFKELPNDTLKRDKNYFMDSTLSSGISYTYAVSAIDFYGNESAKSTSAYYTSRSGMPVPPEITRVAVTDEGTLIEWGQLVDNRITGVKIFRTSPGKATVLLDAVTPDKDQYTDKDTVPGALYIYQLSVTLKSGQESSKSKEVAVRR
jgi:fibronectin type 3 domain-containing protein